MSKVSEPLPNELFSSWLFRQGAIPRVGKLPLYDLVEIYQDCMQKGDFDPDFDQYSEFVSRSLKQLELSRSDFDSFSQKCSWLIPRYYRGAFCYHCFCDHIQQFKVPTMLAEWCSVFHTVCSIHLVPLLDTPGVYNYKLSMALKLFGYYHAANNIVFKAHSGLEIEAMPALLSVQAYMFRVENSILSEGVDDSKWRLIQLLIRVFLYPRHGIITSLFPKQAINTDTQLFRYNLHVGPLASNVARRRLATLLTGLILDVVEDGDRPIAERYLRSFDQRHHYFDNFSGLGRSANVFTQDRGRQLSTQLIELSRNIYNPHLDGFISGFSGRFR